MAKNIDNMNPFHEEEHEDEARIYKNDKKHSFVPPGQVPDKGRTDVLEDVAVESNKDPEKNENDEFQAAMDNFDDDEEFDSEMEKHGHTIDGTVRIKQVEGAASVGPDVPGKELDEADIEVVKDGKEFTPHIYAPGIDSMNHQKVAPSSYDTNRDIRRSFRARKRIENPVTASTSKRERGLRGVLRRFLGKDAA